MKSPTTLEGAREKMTTLNFELSKRQANRIVQE